MHRAQVSAETVAIDGGKLYLELQRSVERLRDHATRSHQLLTQSQRLLGTGREHCRDRGWDGTATPSDQVEAPDDGHEASESGERELLARQRLLEWEANDLAEVSVEEMGTPRRQFALSIYQAVALSESMGMSEDRLIFHVRAARDRYRRAE